MSTRAEVLEATLARANAEVGTRERRPNWSPVIEQYLRETGITFPAPWCAAFSYSMIDRTCKAHHVDNPVLRSAYCPTIHAWAYSHEILFSQPERGDLFLYYSGGRARHIGFVSTVNGARFATIEGNTNIDGSAEGVGVFARSRPKGPRYQFVRWGLLIPNSSVTAKLRLEVSGNDWGEALLIDGRALFPVREWGRKMGFRVSWSQEEQAVSYDGQELPAELALIDGTAWAPVRDLARFSGLLVAYDGERRAVLVTRRAA